ncbi:hypothetical protein LCGC14_1653740 [marine sediment metagenome]|uniref:Reverse transcriptase domain-containing protein n=1 Tax=marine sediment metagenome TaxID=412755 RepID=A0A0F9HWU7_9ZZZZ
MEFSLHSYLKKLHETDSSPAYLGAIRKNATPLVENQLPVILTIGQLSYITKSPYKHLMRIINRDSDPYRVFSIRKRSGGKRYICVPENYLLTVQKWVHKHILCSCHALKALSSSVTAYTPESSHIKNAKHHLDADWILKFDIINFFESISERQVYYVFRRFGYRALVAFCLARLCTRVLDQRIDVRRKKKRWAINKVKWKNLTTSTMGHLPQGAPTSPMLANLVCVELDKELKNIAINEGLHYTRYADDIALSGSIKDSNVTRSLISEISSVIGKHGYDVNHRKTKVAKNGSRKIITGLSVDGDKLRVPKKYKDEIRKDLYYIKKYGLEGHCAKIEYKNYLTYIMRLKGRIQYVLLIEHAVGEKLLCMFKEIFPKFHQLENLLK